MSQAVRRMTYDDYMALPDPDDGSRIELIDGEFVVTPSPLTRHQIISGRLHYEFFTSLVKPGLATVLYAPMDIVFSNHNVIQPDILVVLNENDVIRERGLDGPPDHVVEILSPSTQRRDLGVKRSLYERFGVKEYWIVDPESETLTQLVLENGRYIERNHADMVTAEYVEGLAIDLSKLW